MNNFEMPLVVPHYDEDQLGSSSLILADQIGACRYQQHRGGSVRHPQLEGASSGRRHLQAE